MCLKIVVLLMKGLTKNKMLSDSCTGSHFFLLYYCASASSHQDMFIRMLTENGVPRNVLLSDVPTIVQYKLIVIVVVRNSNFKFECCEFEFTSAQK